MSFREVGDFVDALSAVSVHRLTGWLFPICLISTLAESVVGFSLMSTSHMNFVEGRVNWRFSIQDARTGLHRLYPVNS